MDVSLSEVGPSRAAVGMWADEIALSKAMADLGFSDDTEVTVKGYHVPQGASMFLNLAQLLVSPAASSMASKRQFTSRVMSSQVSRPLGM